MFYVIHHYQRIDMRSFIFILLVLFVNSVRATDLMDIYWLAYQNDPIFQKARATRCAQSELVPQAASHLLPNVNATAGIAWNKNFTLRSVPPSAVPLGVTTFPTKNYLVNFSQPILDLSDWFLTWRAKALDKQAEAVLLAAAQDLIVRVVRAYLTVLTAQDDLYYAELQLETNAKQLALSKKRYHLGIDIITGIYNAQASYDVAKEEVITAQNNLQNSIVALTLLTGCPYKYIEKLKHTMPLLPPCPYCLNDWVQAAIKHNLNIVGAYYGMLAARENIKANFSNHFPTISLVASQGKSYGQSTGLADTENNLFGLQLNLPIVEGGLVLSQTRQAQDQFNEQYQEYRNQYLQAVTQTQQRYNDVLNGIRSVEADRHSVASAALSLKSTQAAFKFGTRSIFDVLISQNQLYIAQRTLSRDQYTYLLNTILLKQQSGNVTMNDVCYINQLLH